MTATMAVVAPAGSAQAGTAPGSWDEQVVPALRKRLQAESVMLSRRMSHTRPTDATADYAAGQEDARLGAVPISIIPSTPTPRSANFPGLDHPPLPRTSPGNASASTSPPISRIPLPRTNRSGSASSVSTLSGGDGPATSSGGGGGEKRTRPRARSRSGSTSGGSASGIPIRARTKSSPMMPQGLAMARGEGGGGSGEGVPAVPKGSRLMPGTGGGVAGGAGGRPRVGRSGSDESGLSVGSRGSGLSAGGRSSEKNARARGDRLEPRARGDQDRDRPRRSTDSLDLATSLSRSLPASTSRADHGRTQKNTLDNSQIRDEPPPFVLERGGEVVSAGAGEGSARPWDTRGRDRDEALRIAREGWDLGLGSPDARRTDGPMGRADRRALPGQSVQAVIEANKPNGSGAKGLQPLSATARGSPRTAGKASAPPKTGATPKSASVNDFGRLINGNGAGNAGSMPTSSSLRSLNSSARERERSERKELPPAAFMIPRIDEWTPPKGTNWDEVVLPAVAKKLGMGSSPEMQVDVWGRRAGEDGEMPMRLRTRGGQPGDDAGYDDLLDAYHEEHDGGANTLDARAGPPGSGTPLGSPIDASANPPGSASGSDRIPHSLKHQQSTESGRFGVKRKPSNLQHQVSSQSIPMQGLRQQQQGSLGGQGALSQLSATGRGTAQADFPPPPPPSDKRGTKAKKAKDGHGKGCGCTIM